MNGYSAVRIEMSEMEKKEYALKNGFNDGYEMFKDFGMNIKFPKFKNKGEL